MKKFFSLTLALLLLLPLFSFASFGDGAGLWQEADVDALWQQKLEHSGFIGGRGIGENVREEHFIREINMLTPLLFTDAFKDLTFEVRYAHPDSWEDGPECWIAEDAQFAYPIAGEMGYRYIYSEELQQILEQYCYKMGADERLEDILYLPFLRGCIEAFGITREELEAACVKSRENPDAARQVLSALSDEEFEIRKLSGKLSSDIDTDSFLMDVLYLPDEQDVRTLLMHHFSTNVNGVTIWTADFLGNYQLSGVGSDEWLEQQDLSTPFFRKFLENAKRSYESDVKYNPHIRYPSDTPERLAHFEELANRPPKTGENTAIYALIFTLAVLPLGVFAIGAFKKRKERFSII